jgi:hypothetical protein
VTQFCHLSPLIDGYDVADKPQFQLLKLLLPPLLELLHPVSIWCCIGQVNDELHQSVPIGHAGMAPVAFDALGFVTCRAELIDDLKTASASDSGGTSRPSLN